MSKTQAVGRVGGIDNFGGSRSLKARVLGIEKTNLGARTTIKLLDPPPSLAGIDKCILIGNHPALPGGTNILVMHLRHDQFIFRSRTEINRSAPATVPAPAETAPNLGKADTQPGIAINLAKLSGSSTLPGLGNAQSGADQPLFDKGWFVRFNPQDKNMILRHGELLLLPDRYILPAERPEHEMHFDFVRLNHTVAYENGRGISLCCSAGYFRMMEIILRALRSENVFSAEMGQAVPAPDYLLRNPGLRKLDADQAGVWHIYPEELRSEYNFDLPVAYAQLKNDHLPAKVHFKLLLEVENPAAQKIRVFNPFGGSVIDLIHDLMNFDFRALVMKKE